MPIRFQAVLTHLHPFWKHGASNTKTLERILRNQLSNCSSKGKDTCPPKPEPPACRLPEPNTCEPPKETSLGRSKGQPEAFPCDPDCRKGKPNFPPRACLPWEKGSELCPKKEVTRKLESLTCEHYCEPYAGQGFIDKFKVSACEYRRFEKCLDKTKDPRKCLDLAPKTGLSRKIYPMVHAVQKQYLPGCPTKLPQFVKPEKDPEC